jgi:hypothetical protein
MNLYEAKHLPLPEILTKLGHNPLKVTKGGKEFWYKSPFREETDPSFHTSVGRLGFWIWNDFGSTGGTVIDFMLKYHNSSDVSQVLRLLSGMFQNHAPPAPIYSSRVVENKDPDLFAYAAEAPKAEEAPQLQFISAAALTNPIILDYLKDERCIPPYIAQHYLKEIRYKNTKNGKEYFAFGMENLSGGYEIRTASSQHPFKSALNGRDITIIRGTHPAKRIVNVFEGMTDFLSFVVMMNYERLTGDALIMHSLSSFSKTAPRIAAEGYTTINTFLDNNPAGLEGTEKFKTTFAEVVKPHNAMYAMYVDLNDALRDNASLIMSHRPT